MAGSRIGKIDQGSLPSGSNFPEVSLHPLPGEETGYA